MPTCMVTVSRVRQPGCQETKAMHDNNMQCETEIRDKEDEDGDDDECSPRTGCLGL